MPNIIPPLLYVFTTYILYRRLGRFYSLSVFIWLMHTVSMLCFWIKADFFKPFQNDYTIEALMLMYGTLLLITIPLVYYERRLTKISLVKIINERQLKNVSIILIVIGLYAIFFFSINLPKVFAMDIVQLRDERIVFYESNIFSKIAILGAFCSVFSIYFFFYYSLLKKDKTIRNLLIITSTSFIFYTLNVAGRDGIVIWTLSFIAAFFLFHRFLEKSFVKSIRKVLLISVIIVSPVLVFITSSRFSSGYEDNSAFDSVLSYAGQSLPNLSYKIDLTNKINRRSGDGVFPIALLRGLMGGDTDRFDRMEKSAAYGFRSNQFSSYVSYFYPSYPIYFLILFIIVFNLIVMNSTKGRTCFNVTNFLPAYTWSMIPIVGIFYFYYGELIGNVFLLLPFFFRYYLMLNNNSSEYKQV